MGDVTWPLDRENEAIRRFITPAQVALWGLQAVERAVYLDAVHGPRGERQFIVLAQALGVEVLAPGAIAPPGNADADIAHAVVLITGSLFGYCGIATGAEGQGFTACDQRERPLTG